MIIIYNHGLIGDPTKAKVEIDQRMLDFCVGLDTEFSEAVEGSHLYFPKTKFEQVNILAEVCESGFYLGFKFGGEAIVDNVAGGVCTGEGCVPSCMKCENRGIL